MYNPFAYHEIEIDCPICKNPVSLCIRETLQTLHEPASCEIWDIYRVDCECSESPYLSRDWHELLLESAIDRVS